VARRTRRNHRPFGPARLAEPGCDSPTSTRTSKDGFQASRNPGSDEEAHNGRGVGLKAVLSSFARPWGSRSRTPARGVSSRSPRAGCGTLRRSIARIAREAYVWAFWRSMLLPAIDHLPRVSTANSKYRPRYRPSRIYSFCWCFVATGSRAVDAVDVFLSLGASCLCVYPWGISERRSVCR
jgi:hypothetical protein